mgnify:FL=1
MEIGKISRFPSSDSPPNQALSSLLLVLRQPNLIRDMEHYERKRQWRWKNREEEEKIGMPKHTSMSNSHIRGRKLKDAH